MSAEEFHYVIMRYTTVDSTGFSWTKDELYLNFKPFERREFSIHADHRLVKVSSVEAWHTNSYPWQWK